MILIKVLQGTSQLIGFLRKPHFASVALFSRYLFARDWTFDIRHFSKCLPCIDILWHNATVIFVSKNICVTHSHYLEGVGHFNRTIIVVMNFKMFFLELQATMT